ncbi:MAG: metallophosphoesterase [Bacteroidota bacterium]
MKKLIRLLLATTITSLLASCASYKIQYADEQKDWAKTPLPNKPLQHQVFLIGDAGGDKDGKPVETLRIVEQKLRQAGKNSSVIFLGDNIYPHGLPAEGEAGRTTAESNLKAQLEILQQFPGKIFFIPGNHDWETEDGVEGIRRQEKFVQDYLDRGDTFLPDDGCSGPEVEDLSENTVLMAIDSQWYLENWDSEEDINEDCEFRTRELFLREVMDKIKDNREKNIVLAMHHPLNTNGRHGGHYSLKEHLFPLTILNKNLLVPLPGLGSALAFLSSAIARPQELAHPNYRTLKESLLDIADKFTNVIFVSGHEHSLQYFEEDNQYFIVSGAGSRRTPVGLGDDAEFVAGVEGFSTLNIYEDGAVWVEFWATSDRKGRPVAESTVIFRKKVRDPLPTKEELTPNTYPEYQQIKDQDSVTFSIMKDEELKVFNQTFWGHLYTEDYLTPFKMPVLDLATAKGGLKAFEKGGGNQSNSVRLKTEDGKIYQLRSVRKVTERFPSIVRKTFANELVKQQLTAGNPFSALAVAPMASTINVFHSNPEIVYVPKQPNLGKYNEFGGEVYLFEERGDGDWSDLESFGHPDEIENMGNVIEGLLKNDKTIIDQKQVLRSRLFDNIIGDWDRHSDQWRWAGYEMEDDKMLYKPIPRDRDQAYSNFDGIANWLASYTVPFTRAAHKYDGEITKKDETWLNHQARLFDRVFLNELTLAEWEKEAKFIKENLTDAAIETGIRRLPPFAFESRGKQLIKWTKQRRDNILITARNYYKILNEEVQILGTHKDNLIQVERLNNLQTKVTVYEYADDGAVTQLLYERILENQVTKEVRIYGLDGDDRFEVSGKVRKSPLLRLIGGNGKDSFVDNSKVTGLRNKTKVYDDDQEEITLDLGSEAKDKRSHREALNSFDYREFNYNYTIPVPFIGFNPDDGVFVGVGLNAHTYSFKRQQLHRFLGSYAIGSGGFNFSYEGDYFNTFDNWDTYLKIVAEVPRFVNNFHGLGNETVRDIDQFGRDYYRVRRTLLGAYPAFKKRGDGGTVWSIGPALESIKIEDLDNRITSDENPMFSDDTFEQRLFTGGHTRFSFFNADHPAIPTQGLGFEAGAVWRANLDDFDRQMVRLNSELKFYLRLGVTDRFVLANRIGADHIIGKFDFFQAVNIGGEGQLRGFALQRFSGRTAFFHNVDLRIKVLDSENQTIPVSGGITPGFDYGRVWIDTEESDRWHVNYGATFWIAPLDYIALSVGYFRSSSSDRLTVRAGFQF